MATLWTARKTPAAPRWPLYLLGAITVLLLLLVAAVLAAPKWISGIVHGELEQAFPQGVVLELAEVGPWGARVEAVELQREGLRLAASGVDVTYGPLALLKRRISTATVEGLRVEVDVARASDAAGDAVADATPKPVASGFKSYFPPVDMFNATSATLVIVNGDEVRELPMDMDLRPAETGGREFTGRLGEAGQGFELIGSLDESAGTSEWAMKLESDTPLAWLTLLGRARLLPDGLAVRLSGISAEGGLALHADGVTGWGGSASLWDVALEYSGAGGEFSQLEAALRGDALGLSGLSLGGKCERLGWKALRLGGFGFLFKQSADGTLAGSLKGAALAWEETVAAVVDAQVSAQLADPLADTHLKGDLHWDELVLAGTPIEPGVLAFEGARDVFTLAVPELASPALGGVVLHDAGIRYERSGGDAYSAAAVGALSFTVEGMGLLEGGLEAAWQHTDPLPVAMRWKLEDRRVEIERENFSLSLRLDLGVNAHALGKAAGGDVALKARDLAMKAGALELAVPALTADFHLRDRPLEVWKHYLGSEASTFDKLLGLKPALKADSGSLSLGPFKIEPLVAGFKPTDKGLRINAGGPLKGYGWPVIINQTISHGDGFRVGGDVIVEPRELQGFIVPDTAPGALAGAVVDGVLAARASVAYGASGLKGVAAVSFQHGVMDFSGLGLKIEGIDAPVNFSGLAPLQTAGEQSLSFSRLSTGDFTMEDGGVRYGIAENVLTVGGAQALWAGGVITVEPFRCDLEKPSVQVTLRFRNISMEQLRPMILPKAQDLSGRISGYVTFVFNELGIRPIDGLLELEEGSPAHISYVDPGWSDRIYGGDAALEAQYKQYAEEALADLDISYVSVELYPEEAGNQPLKLRLVGRSENGGRSVNLNLDNFSIIGDLPELLNMGIFFKQFKDFEFSAE